MRKVQAKFLVLMVLISLIIAGCGSSSAPSSSSSTPSAGYTDISAEQLKSMIDSNKNMVIVDVREKDEYDQGHIQGALFLPLSEIQQRFKELPTDKTLVLVCASGARSSSAATFLVQNNYKDLYNLQGGLAAWPYELVK